jgi:phosphoribosylformimino-5-aminoimidazole carboxamide ribonucleotide (ProFAR) isomerase
VEKRILSYSDYVARKKGVTESSTQEGKALNEGFLDAIVRFFKGMLDLFNNKELKKETSDSANYWKDIEDNDNISDEEISDEIDSKRVRKSSEKASKTIVNQIDVDTETGIRTTEDLRKKLASWIAQMVTWEDQINKMPILKKLLSNTEASKRFVWVPSDFRQGKDKPAKKEWFSQKNCVLEKQVAAEWLKVAETKDEKVIKEFAKKFIDYVAKGRENGLKKLKENQPDFLDDMFAGLAAMCRGIMISASSVVKNTPDDKMNEIIADEIIQSRKRKAIKSKPAYVKPAEKEAEEGEEEDETSSSRSRKSGKETKKEATA